MNQDVKERVESTPTLELLDNLISSYEFLLKKAEVKIDMSDTSYYTLTKKRLRTELEILHFLSRFFSTQFSEGLYITPDGKVFDEDRYVVSRFSDYYEEIVGWINRERRIELENK